MEFQTLKRKLTDKFKTDMWADGYSPEEVSGVLANLQEILDDIGLSQLQLVMLWDKFDGQNFKGDSELWLLNKEKPLALPIYTPFVTREWTDLFVKALLAVKSGELPLEEVHITVINNTNGYIAC